MQYQGAAGSFYAIGQLLTGSDNAYQRALQRNNAITTQMSGEPRYVAGESSYADYINYRRWTANTTGEPFRAVSESTFYANYPNLRPAANGAPPLYNVYPTRVGGTAGVISPTIQQLNDQKPISGPGITVTPSTNSGNGPTPDGQIITLDSPGIQVARQTAGFDFTPGTAQQQFIIVSGSKVKVEIMFRITGPVATCFCTMDFDSVIGTRSIVKAVGYILPQDPAAGLSILPLYSTNGLMTILDKNSIRFGITVPASGIMIGHLHIIIDLDNVQLPTFYL